MGRLTHFQQQRQFNSNSLRHYRLFREMSKPFHIYKQPITFDGNDIRYLMQFPRKYWVQAMTRRYRTDLFQALKDRHERRQSIYDLKYHDVIDGLMEKWEKKKGDNEIAEKMARREAALIAEEFAAKHPQGKVEYPEEKDYTFKGAGRAKAETVRAKTFMVALVHKLEGRYGDPDGFDLEHPRVSEGGDRMATRGFTFPTQKAIGDMVSEWLNYIGHHMLGDAPKGVEWKADHAGGSGKGSKYSDTFVVNRLEEEREKFWYGQIPTEENVVRLWQQVMGDRNASDRQIRDDNTKRAALARALANRDVKKMVGEGKVKTPPTAGHPDGRTLELGDDGEIVVPELHLPHVKSTIKFVNDDGDVEEQEVKLPHLMPGDFLRKGSPDELATADPDDLRGLHWNHETGKFEKQYIRVKNHPSPGAQGTDHLRAGALNPNHNSTGRKFLDPSDEGYEDRLDALHYEIGLRPDGQSAEIYESIEQALKATNVGGMGNYERQILWMMKRDLHNLAYMKFMENLDEDDKRLFSAEWRKRKVRELVAQYGQQDWGRGTRRTRGSKTTNSLDQDVETQDGTMSLADVLGTQLEKAKKTAQAMKDSGACKVEPGGRHLNTGQCQFQYDIRQLHAMLDAANVEATQADARLQRGEDSMDGDTMGIGVKEKLDATFRAFTVLQAQFQNMGWGEAEAERKAHEILKKITEDEPSARKIVQRVRYQIDKLAKQAGEGVEKAKIKPVDDAADEEPDSDKQNTAANTLSQIEQALAGMLDRGEIDKYLQMVNQRDFTGSINQLIQKYPSLKTRYERLLSQAQEVRNHAARPAPPVRPTTPAARTVGAEADRVDLKSLIDNERIELIPFNRQFRRLVAERKVSPQKLRDMLDQLLERKGTLFQHDMDDEAIAAFKELLGVA